MPGNINAGVVSATQLLENGVGMFGVGQTYQDVTLSRAKDITYTNSTGRTIFVIVVFATNGGTPTITVGGQSIQGTTVQNASPFNTHVSFPVASGTTYSVTISAGTLAKWIELR